MLMLRYSLSIKVWRHKAYEYGNPMQIPLSLVDWSMAGWVLSWLSHTCVSQVHADCYVASNGIRRLIS